MVDYRKFLYPHPTHPQYDPSCREVVKKRHSLARDYLYGDILDAPCGCGWGASIYMKDNPKIKSVTGIDLCQEALDYGKENYKNIKFISQNILELDYKEKYDCVVSFEAIEHLTMAEGIKYINNIYNALQIGGIALFSTPNINYPTTKEYPKGDEYGKTQFHLTLYSRKDLRSLLSVFDKVNFYNLIDKAFFVVCKKEKKKIECDVNDTKTKYAGNNKVVIL